MLKYIINTFFGKTHGRNGEQKAEHIDAVLLNSRVGISADYAQLNAQLHADRSDYGVSGQQWAPLVDELTRVIPCHSVLDYGCGKQTLSQALPHIQIKGYDPAIPALSATPSPADLVVCTDVLEHVEPIYLEVVLDELARLAVKAAFVTVATRPAVKTLADGRNAHLIVQPLSWWKNRFEERFDIIDIQELPGFEFCLLLRALTYDGPIDIALPASHKKNKNDKNLTNNANASGIKTGTTVLRHSGGSIKFSTPNPMTQWRVNSFYEKEPDTIQWLDSMDSGSILLDVGANVGMYSIYAASARKVKVYAFEPESQNYALLNQNIELNGLTDEVIAYPLALSDQIKIDTLYLSDFSAGGSCHSFASEVGFDLQPRKSPFKQGSFCFTIDELVKSGAMPVPDYIKIDVDGFEHSVVSGALITLKNPKVRGILVELNTNLNEHLIVVSQLEEMGFIHDKEKSRNALRKTGPFKGVGEYIFYRNQKLAFEFNKVVYIKPPLSQKMRKVFQHVLNQANQAELINTPFPYLVVDNIFPADYYQEILDNFPAKESTKPLSESGRVPLGSYEERLSVLFNPDDFARLTPAQNLFWTEFGSWLYSEQFLNFFLFKFHDALEIRINNILKNEGALKLKGDALLVNDQTNYAIGPHTDAPHRLVTFLFYMPEDESMKELGTSIYTPKDSGFTCWGGPHYPHADFNLVDTVSFLPNRMLAFPKTEHTFHGVEKINREKTNRHLLINNIRVMGKTTH